MRKVRKNINLEKPMHFTKEQSKWIKAYVIVKKQEARADMLTEIKAKARKYHRGKDEPVEFVIYENELEQLKEQK